jgi:hypothetical protein
VDCRIIDESAQRGDAMKKATITEVKAAPAKKASLKAAVTKAAATVSPKLASNHNETLLVR